MARERPGPHLHRRGGRCGSGRFTLQPMLVFLLLLQLAAPEARHLRNVKQLTHTGKNGESYFSPDGKKIIFQSVRGANPYYQMYTMNADGSGERLVSTGRGKCTCGWFHPTQAKILFASTHLDPNAFAPGTSAAPPPLRPSE